MKITITLKSDTRTATTFNVFKRTAKNTEQLIGVHRWDKEACKHTFTELHRSKTEKYQRVLTEDQMFEVFDKTKELVNKYKG